MRRRPAGKAVLIAGPTASGKSALALALAREIGGTIINADSMQVYRDLRVITARPTPEEEASAPHRLYGHVDAAENYSVGRWLADVAPALRDVRAPARVPVLVGGTGLYFKALTQGLSAVPPVPQEIRAAVRARLEARRAGRAACGTAAARAGDATRAGRPHPDRARAGGAGGDRASARAMAPRGPAAAARRVRRREGLSRARARRIRRRIDARFDAMIDAGRAGRSARAGGARARSAAARHEGAWRALAGPPSRGRDHARRGGRRARRTTRAATPSGSSPGRGISCRTGPGWRPTARGEGWRLAGFWGAETGTTTRRPRA